MGTYQVVVGNIGTVYEGTDKDKAQANYDEYERQSMTGYGRAAGEPVCLMRDGDVIVELEV